MNYSVYILALDEDGLKLSDLVESGSLLGAMTQAAVGAASNLVGFDFFEKFANKLKSTDSVALTGSDVEDIRITTSLSKITNYKISPTNWEDVGKKSLIQTFTIMGKLHQANTLFGLGNKLAKKKNIARLWKWANTPFPGYEKDGNDCFRDIMVIISGTDKKRYRAFFAHKVMCYAYEETYDKDGTGHFTLVAGTMIMKEADEKPAQALVSIEEKSNTKFDEKEAKGKDDAAKKISRVRVIGPDFNITAMSAIGNTGKAINTASKNLKTGTKVAKKIVGKDNKATNDILDKIDATNNLVNTSAQSTIDKFSKPNYTKDKLSEDIGKNIDAMKAYDEAFKEDKDKGKK